VLAVLARLPLNTTQDTRALLDASREATELGFTPVLVTRSEYSVGLGDHLRSGLVVIPSTGEQSQRWVRFPDAVDFNRCMPAEQEPSTGK
jgi:hypothetical protein